jgi:hypothetical protein
MQWKPVPGWEERYEVSDTGVIRSLDMRCGSRYGFTALRRGRVLKQVAKEGRYLAVTLTAPGRRAQLFVHDVVALAFIGPKPEGLQTCHGDDVKTNNAASNLRYDTPQANNDDRWLNDGIAYGERHGRALLTEQHVREIRQRRNEPRSTLAAEFGVTASHIHSVQSRRVWKHLKD